LFLDPVSDLSAHFQSLEIIDLTAIHNHATLTATVEDDAISDPLEALGYGFKLGNLLVVGFNRRTTGPGARAGNGVGRDHKVSEIRRGRFIKVVGAHRMDDVGR